MKATSVISAIVFNAIALILAVLVYDDRVSRIAYWHLMGFTPHTVYYPFFYITTAVKGSTYIAGLLTVDWLQVLLVVAVVVDGSIALGAVRGRPRPPAEPAPKI